MANYYVPHACQNFLASITANGAGKGTQNILRALTMKVVVNVGAPLIGVGTISLLHSLKRGLAKGGKWLDNIAIPTQASRQ